jgi:hypothetical protein
MRGESKRKEGRGGRGQREEGEEVEEGGDGEDLLKLVDCKDSTPSLLLVRKYGLQSPIRGGTQVEERKRRVRR